MHPLRQRRGRHRFSPTLVSTSFGAMILHGSGAVRFVYGAEPVRARGRMRVEHRFFAFDPVSLRSPLFLLPRSPRWPDTKDRRLHVGRLYVRSGVFRRLCLLCASVARGFTGRDSRGVSAVFDLAETVLAGASAVLLALINRPGHVLRFSSSRGSGIRTHGRIIATGFQDQRIRPLCHAPQQIVLAGIIRSSYQATTIGSGAV
jgi:hypothetical protein